jgi:hypothetical protein
MGYSPRYRTRKVWTLRTRSCEHVERMVELEASQASAGCQLSDALLPVAIRCVWREMWLFWCSDLLHHAHAISTMSPSCARCASTGSNASLVYYYGLPTAWGAPACLHAAACADRNSVSLSPQLYDRSARAPQLLHSGLYMAMEQCRSLWENREAVRGPLAASPNVVRMASRAMRSSTRSTPLPALKLRSVTAMDV